MNARTIPSALRCAALSRAALLTLRRTVAWGALFSLLLAGPREAQAINASPHPIALTQPDGARVTLHIRGDEFLHWYEDAAGYAVVRDAARRYVYAAQAAGGGLAPTAVVVGRADPAASGIAAGLRPSAAALNAARVALAPPPRPPGAPEGVPPVGTVRNLVVLCLFSDHTVGTHGRPQADYHTLFNAVGGDPTLAPTGSVRDYYSEASYGTMTLDSTVVAWVTLPQTEAYYANGEDGLGTTFPTNPQGMVRDALNLVDPLVNFAQFDQDNDGFIDSISIVHSGYGAETGGGGGNWIWSHRWALYQLPGGNWASQDLNGSNVPVKVYDYHTEPALWGTSGTSIVRIGVICHETGHFFGLPDLYDTNGGGRGLGSWCLMANSWGFDGTQLRPPHPSAWCKEQLGWVTPTVIASGSYSAPRVQTTPTIYKITGGFPNGEYLLVENRQPYGYDSLIPGGGGLAIWHIDENKGSNAEEGYPGQSGWPGNNLHYRVALLQADGLYQLERGASSGDAGDLYRGGGVTSISPTTVPSTDRYQDGIVASTDNTIADISASGVTMAFNLNVASGPPVITSASTASGAPGVPFSYQLVATNLPTSYGATPLPPGLSVNPTTGLISGTPTTIGITAVTLSATNGFGTGTAVLAIDIMDIPTLGEALDAPALTWTTGGTSVWAGQRTVTHDTVDAAVSGVIDHSQQSWVETSVAGPGTLTFWWQVSSESGYDYLSFLLDGAATGGAPAISGTVGWTQQTVAIPSGTHTLRWRYSKDGSVVAGSDAGWVDQVVYVPDAPAPEIRVEQPAGTPLTDGAATVSFTTTAVGVPVEKTFTVRNVGTLDLTGLILTWDGAQAGDFQPGALGATTLAAGASTTFSVTFTPSATGTRTAALHLASNDGDENPFDIALSGRVTTEQEFTGGTIIIPDSGNATPYPATIDIAGVSGTVLAFRVKLNGITHTYGDDIDAFLVAPDGQVCALMSDAGGSFGLVGVDVVFDDTAATAIPDATAITSGSYLPANHGGTESLPPGGVGTIGTNLLAVTSGGVNGQWKLFVTDDASGDSGTIASWAIVVEAGGPEIRVEQPPGTSLVDGASTVVFSPTATGTSIARTFTITNDGSSPLTGLAATRDGTHASDFIVGALGATTLAPGASTTFTVTLTPTAGGTRTAALHVASNDADENPFDVALSGIGLTRLESWRLTHFGNSSDTGIGANSADPDSDGLHNFYEFATGTDPTAMTNTPTYGLSKSGATLIFTYQRSKEALADGWTFTVEWTDALTLPGWSPVGVTETLISEDSKVQQMEATLSAGSVGHRFVRLRVD
jgi:M6 family metalloprotease-like protein